MIEIKIKCPYCGLLQVRDYNETEPPMKPKTTFCDIVEVDGCDNLFFYRVILPSIEIAKIVFVETMSHD